MAVYNCPSCGYMVGELNVLLDHKGCAHNENMTGGDMRPNQGAPDDKDRVAELERQIRKLDIQIEKLQAPRH